MVKIISLIYFLCIGLCETWGRVTLPVPNEISATALDENDTPIIGILAQEISYHLNKVYPNQYKSYIAASYVKFVEGGGARPVPIWIDQPREYYVDVLNKVNGVLLPGGATFFNQSNGYADAGQHIWDIAAEMNENGRYMPLWGTCLGFELLTYLSAHRDEHRARCSSSSQSLPLEFKADFRDSRMFKGAPDDVIEILKTQAVTPNFHMYCITEKNITEYGLDDQWRVMSVNHDWKGFEFISTIEHKKYPFYGIQFHPEKNIYEWVLNKNISHTPEAIQAAQYFSDFFIDEARKSSNRFVNKNEENDFLIYNFAPTFTGRKGSSFMQSYLFPANVEYGNCRSGANASMFPSLSVMFLIIYIIFVK